MQIKDVGVEVKFIIKAVLILVPKRIFLKWEWEGKWEWECK